MPAFGLSHKPSRSKLRQASSESDTTIVPDNYSRTVTQTQPPISPAPQPIETPANSGFKMFSWKRKGSASSVGSASHVDGASRPYYPADPPRPILKTAVSDQGASGRGIRFAPSAGGVWPDAVSPNAGAVRGDANGQGGGGQPLFNRPPPPQLSIRVHQANLEKQEQTLESMGVTSPTRSVTRAKSTSPRRSSRPASPSVSSFGHRIRTESAPSSSTAASCPSPTSESQQNRWRESPRQTSVPASASPIMCTPPPVRAFHVTTPPAAYCSSMQSRQPPPPSPYRPTTSQERHWTGNRTLPEQLPMTREMAPRPPRHSSLFAVNGTPRSSRVGSRPVSGASLHTLPGVDVPVFNIIPATPQDQNDEFSGHVAGPSRPRLAEELGEAVTLHRMTEISLGEDEREEISTEVLPRTDSSPAIKVELDFSPFSPTIDLALDDYLSSASQRQDENTPKPGDGEHAAVEAGTVTVPAPANQSPPFESYPSLPSLSSQTSLSERSMKSSSSMASIVTFPDVEEALGSMLASLSDGNMSFTDSDVALHARTIRDRETDEIKRPATAPPNPGLGLGLDIPDSASISSSLPITAPLSPRKHKPGRIDTALAQSVLSRPTEGHVPSSAPPVINHRIAFYGTARAHPNSPSSGIFTRSLDDIASHCDQPAPDATNLNPNVNVNAIVEAEAGAITPTMAHKGLPPSFPSSGALSTASRDSVSTVSQGTIGCRDSISTHSESSDDDLHTASIINLAPMGAGRPFAEVRGEEVIVDEVGLAL